MKKNGDYICKACGPKDIYAIYFNCLQSGVFWEDAGLEAALARVEGYWKGSAHRPQSAVQSKLSHYHKLIQALLREPY